MPTQLDKLFVKGLSIPHRKEWGRQIAAEVCGSRIAPVTYVLHMESPTEYNIVRLAPDGRPSGAVRVTLKGVVYVAGPMRGIAKYNFPAFDAARDKLIEAGFFVFNPADLDRATGVNENTTVLPPYFIRDAMDRDCNAICRCTHIFLLPGWEDSSGVRPEGVLGDALGDLTFITGETLTAVPSQAVTAVIGGRLVSRYQKWQAAQEATGSVPVH